jgi:hypothetical protein
MILAGARSYAMISRMRVISSIRTAERADEIMRKTIATYFAPNKTIRELNELIISGAGSDSSKGIWRSSARRAPGTSDAVKFRVLEIRDSARVRRQTSDS